MSLFHLLCVASSSVAADLVGMSPPWLLAFAGLGGNGHVRPWSECIGILFECSLALFAVWLIYRFFRYTDEARAFVYEAGASCVSAALMTGALFQLARVFGWMP